MFLNLFIHVYLLHCRAGAGLRQPIAAKHNDIAVFQGCVFLKEMLIRFDWFMLSVINIMDLNLIPFRHIDVWVLKYLFFFTFYLKKRGHLAGKEKHIDESFFILGLTNKYLVVSYWLNILNCFVINLLMTTSHFSSYLYRSKRVDQTEVNGVV